MASQKVWVQFTRGELCAVFRESDEQRARETLGPSMTLALFEEVAGVKPEPQVAPCWCRPINGHHSEDCPRFGLSTT